MLSTKLIKQPRKTIGIFCLELIIPDDIDNVVIDASGRNGDEGSNSATGDGEDGKNGSKAGNVWVFVQSGDEKMLKKLQIRRLGETGDEEAIRVPRKKRGKRERMEKSQKGERAGENLRQAFQKVLLSYLQNARNEWPSRLSQRGFKKFSPAEITALRNSATTIKDANGNMTTECNLFIDVYITRDMTKFQSRIDVRLAKSGSGSSASTSRPTWPDADLCSCNSLTQA